MVTDRRARRLIVCAAALYLLGVARMTLWPDFASPEQLDALRSLVAWLTGHGVPVTYDGVEAAANVVMFVPLSLLGSLIWPRLRVWQWCAVALVASCLIELGQLLVPPDRSASLSDVVANTAGGVVGAVAAWIVRHDSRRV